MHENHICPRCQSACTVKAGFACSKPRRKCGDCGRQFVIGRKKGVDLKRKIHALLLYKEMVEHTMGLFAKFKVNGNEKVLMNIIT